MRLRARLLLLIGAALLPAVAVQVHFERQTRRPRRSRAERGAATGPAGRRRYRKRHRGRPAIPRRRGQSRNAMPPATRRACNRSLAALLPRRAPLCDLHGDRRGRTDHLQRRPRAPGRISPPRLVYSRAAAGWTFAWASTRSAAQRHAEPACRPAPARRPAWPGRHGDRGARPRLAVAAARGRAAAAWRHRLRRRSRRHHPRPLAGAGRASSAAGDARNAAGDRRGRLDVRSGTGIDGVRRTYAVAPIGLRHAGDRRSASASIPRRPRPRLPRRASRRCC